MKWSTFRYKKELVGLVALFILILVIWKVRTQKEGFFSHEGKDLRVHRVLVLPTTSHPRASQQGRRDHVVVQRCAESLFLRKEPLYARARINSNVPWTLVPVKRAVAINEGAIRVEFYRPFQVTDQDGFIHFYTESSSFEPPIHCNLESPGPPNLPFPSMPGIKPEFSYPPRPEFPYPEIPILAPTKKPEFPYPSRPSFSYPEMPILPPKPEEPIMISYPERSYPPTWR